MTSFGRKPSMTVFKWNRKKGISTVPALVAALIVTLAISGIVIALTLQKVRLPGSSINAYAQRVERETNIRLTLIYVANGKALVSNDGDVSVTIRKVMTEWGEHDVNVKLDPGDKTTLQVGNANDIAVVLSDGSVIVLRGGK